MHRRFIGPVQFRGDRPVPRPSYLGRQDFETNDVMRQVMRAHNLPEDLINNLVGIKGEIMDEEPSVPIQTWGDYYDTHPLDAIDNQHRWREWDQTFDAYGQDSRIPYLRRLPYRHYQEQPSFSDETYGPEDTPVPVSRLWGERMNLSLPRLNRRISKTPIGGRRPKRYLPQEELRAVRSRYYR